MVAGRGWQAGAELSWEDTSWPAAARIPGGRWKCRLKDEYVHDGVRKCFSSQGEELWHESHGPMNKSMQDASAVRAGNAYVARRLGARQVEGASLQEVWDHRPHEGRGGKGTIAQAVWKLKVVWDHAGTGTVRSRDIHQQISRAEKRLAKLNLVEAARLTQAGLVLSTAIRSCQGQDGVGEAMMAAEEGARVGTHLAACSQWGGPGSGRCGRAQPDEARRNGTAGHGQANERQRGTGWSHSSKCGCV